MVCVCLAHCIVFFYPFRRFVISPNETIKICWTRWNFTTNRNSRTLKLVVYSLSIQMVYDEISKTKKKLCDFNLVLLQPLMLSPFRIFSVRVRGCIDDNNDGSQLELNLIQDLYANNAAPLQQIIIQPAVENTRTENENPLTKQIDGCAEFA